MVQGVACLAPRAMRWCARRYDGGRTSVDAWGDCGAALWRVNGAVVPGSRWWRHRRGPRWVGGDAWRLLQDLKKRAPRNMRHLPNRFPVRIFSREWPRKRGSARFATASSADPRRTSQKATFSHCERAGTRFMRMAPTKGFLKISFGVSLQQRLRARLRAFGC